MGWAEAGDSREARAEGPESYRLKFPGAGAAQTMRGPHSIRTALGTGSLSPAGSMTSFCPSARSLHIPRRAWGGPATVLGRLIQSVTAKLLLTSEKAEREEGSVLLWLGVKQSFLDIKVFPGFTSESQRIM